MGELVENCCHLWNGELLVVKGDAESAFHKPDEALPEASPPWGSLGDEGPPDLTLELPG